eukprot:m51a1_g4334 hypothetical protein (795) ;mRNA; f:148341-150855
MDEETFLAVKPTATVSVLTDAITWAGETLPADRRLRKDELAAILKRLQDARRRPDAAEPTEPVHTSRKTRPDGAASAAADETPARRGTKRARPAETRPEDDEEARARTPARKTSRRAAAARAEEAAASSGSESDGAARGRRGGGNKRPLHESTAAAEEAAGAEEARTPARKASRRGRKESEEEGEGADERKTPAAHRTPRRRAQHGETAGEGEGEGADERKTPAAHRTPRRRAAEGEATTEEEEEAEAEEEGGKRAEAEAAAATPKGAKKHGRNVFQSAEKKSKSLLVINTEEPSSGDNPDSPTLRKSVTAPAAAAAAAAAPSAEPRDQPHSQQRETASEARPDTHEAAPAMPQQQQQQGAVPAIRADASFLQPPQQPAMAPRHIGDSRAAAAAAAPAHRASLPQQQQLQPLLAPQEAQQGRSRSLEILGSLRRRLSLLSGGGAPAGPQQPEPEPEPQEPVLEEEEQERRQVGRAAMLRACSVFLVVALLASAYVLTGAALLFGFPGLFEPPAVTFCAAAPAAAAPGCIACPQRATCAAHEFTCETGYRKSGLMCVENELLAELAKDMGVEAPRLLRSRKGQFLCGKSLTPEYTEAELVHLLAVTLSCEPEYARQAFDIAQQSGQLYELQAEGKGPERLYWTVDASKPWLCAARELLDSVNVLSTASEWASRHVGAAVACAAAAVVAALAYAGTRRYLHEKRQVRAVFEAVRTQLVEQARQAQTEQMRSLSMAPWIVETHLRDEHGVAPHVWDKVMDLVSADSRVRAVIRNVGGVHQTTLEWIGPIGAPVPLAR